MAPPFGRSRLPELLILNDLSQAEFADELGVSESFISQVISGKKFFSLAMARKASKILKCKIEDLHEWTDE